MNYTSELAQTLRDPDIKDDDRNEVLRSLRELADTGKPGRTGPLSATSSIWTR
jgi:hypothetical protein